MRKRLKEMMNLQTQPSLDAKRKKLANEIAFHNKVLILGCKEAWRMTDTFNKTFQFSDGTYLDIALFSKAAEFSIERQPYTYKPRIRISGTHDRFIEQGRNAIHAGRGAIVVTDTGLPFGQSEIIERSSDKAYLKEYTDGNTAATGRAATKSGDSPNTIDKQTSKG